MTEQPGSVYPPAPYQGQQQPLPLPSYLLNPNAPHYFRASGASVLWSTLLLIPAYVCSVYSGILTILSLILLVLPVTSVIRGYQKTKSVPRASGFPVFAPLFPLLSVAGTGIQDALHLAGNENTIATTFTGYLMGALLLLSLIMLSSVAKHFPEVVSKRERLWSNITVSAFAGSTLSILVMPLIIFMGMFVLVGGWLTYILTVSPFILGIMGTAVYLFVRKDKTNIVSGKLLEWQRIIPYGIIFACLSFVTVASIVFGMMVKSFPSL